MATMSSCVWFLNNTNIEKISIKYEIAFCHRSKYWYTCLPQWWITTRLINALKSNTKLKIIKYILILNVPHIVIIKELIIYDIYLQGMKPVKYRKRYIYKYKCKYIRRKVTCIVLFKCVFIYLRKNW